MGQHAMPPKGVLQAARVFRNAVRDVRFGRPLVGSRTSRHRHLGSKDVVNSDYGALDAIFAGRIRPDDVLVDVGCGKGRVLNWWLAHSHPDQRIVGLELDHDVARRTARRMRRHPNVTVVAGDAIEHLPADGTLFFLYNPFDAAVMARFVDRLQALVPADRDPLILYSNPKYLEAFDPAEWSVAVHPVGGPSAAPYDDLAVIQRRSA